MVLSTVFVKRIALAWLVFLGFLPTTATAANTWLCNASQETLYLSVRHYAASLFTRNARTEGWKKLPTRGVLRSCWILNRTARDHIVVVGVKRGNVIVPITLRPRNARSSRDRYVCVPQSPSFIEYRSDNRSDPSCPSGQQRALASFSVEGGENDVDMDLSGPIRVPSAPSPTAPKTNEKSEALDALAKALTGEGLLKDINALRKLDFATSSSDKSQERIKNWAGYLDGKVIVSGIGRGSTAGNQTIHWLQPEGQLKRLGTTDAKKGERYSEAFFLENKNQEGSFFGSRNRWSIEVLWDVPMLCLYSDAAAKPRPGTIACHQLQWKSDETRRYGGTVSLYGYWIFRVKDRKITADTPLGFPYRVNDAVVDAR